MITMNSRRNETSTENAAAPTPQVHKCPQPPAMPMMKELTANALSLAYMGRMPITAAATSMSRIAIHSRPIAPRTRFLASRPPPPEMARQNRYLLAHFQSGMPSTRRLVTDTEPESELLVNHLMRRNIQSLKNCAGQRGHRQVQALTRRLGSPNRMPKNVAHSPPR